MSDTFDPAASSFGVAARPERAEGEDPLRDIVPLRRLLGNLLEDDAPGRGQITTLRFGLDRLASIQAEINSLLCSARLPLPPALRTLTLALRDMQAQAISGLETIARDPADGMVQVLLLDQLLSQLISCSSVNTLLPTQFWVRALRALSSAKGCRNFAAVNIGFNTLLTTAVVQPESFAPWELIFVVDVARRYADQLTLQRTLPEDPRGWFWLDEEGRYPPMSLAREHFALHDGAYFFCFDGLIESIERDLDHPAPSAGQGLADHVADPAYRTVLNRALSIWKTPLQRKFSRRRVSYRVQVCTRLGELWQSMVHKDAQSVEQSEWMVLNESANGMSIMHVDGDISGLTSGGVVALRLSDTQAWMLCIVRWIRSESSLHVELGVELIAREVYPVRIVPDTGGPPLSALLIPAIEGESDFESLLVICKDLAWREFTLLTEWGGQLRVTSCRFLDPIYDGGPLQLITFERLSLAG